MRKENKIVFILTEDEETRTSTNLQPLIFSGVTPYIIDKEREEIPLIKTGSFEDIEKIACAFREIKTSKIVMVRFQTRMPVDELFPISFSESSKDITWALFAKK